MTQTIAVRRDELADLFDLSQMPGQVYKITISPITEEEAEELEFRSLKGIAGRFLDKDEIRRERLGL